MAKRKMWRVVPREERLRQLESFARRHGHCRVPYSCDDPPGLGEWVIRQRLLRKRGKLSAERVRQLDERGFEWSLRDQAPWAGSWMEMFEQVCAFRAEHGHALVPKRGRHHRLAVWTSTQRCRRSKGLLSQERIRQLDRIDFPWSLRRAETDLRMALFREARHGKVLSRTEREALERWIQAKRHQRAAGTLAPELARELVKLGAVLERRKDQWERRYQELRKFRRRRGHARVTLLEDAKLHRWSSYQRERWRTGQLEKEKQLRLEALGFEFAPPHRTPDHSGPA